VRRLLRNRFVRAGLIALAILALVPLIRAHVLRLPPKTLPMQRPAQTENGY